MLSRGENKFNCCESVLMKVDTEKSLPGFTPEVMRIASNFGGGVSGWGTVCGAVSGACMSLGLEYGTEGDEPATVYSEKREKQRNSTKRFLKAFEDKWGHVNCFDLLGVDFNTPEGKIKYDAMKEAGETHCSEYVLWASEKIIEMLNDR